MYSARIVLRDRDRDRDWWPSYLSARSFTRVKHLAEDVRR
jgi:hypothetical protein